MLDIIIINHISTGVSLIEYRNLDSSMKKEHSNIFSGFLSAIQSISLELRIGQLSIISTEGDNGHHCLICREGPISVILLIDLNDSISYWKDIGHKIGMTFLEQFGDKLEPTIVSHFTKFYQTLDQLIPKNE